MNRLETRVRENDEMNFRRVPQYDEMLSLLVAALPFERNAAVRILDYGCGTGMLAARVREAFPNALITCIDSEVALAQTKLGGDQNIRFVTGDLASWQIDGTYDAVVSSLALHHLVTDEEKIGVLRRIHQHLNEGGVFYIADIVLAANDDLQSVFIEQWKRFMTASTPADEVERKWLLEYYEQDRPNLLSEQLKWLAEIGFREIDVIWKRLNFALFGGVK